MAAVGGSRKPNIGRRTSVASSGRRTSLASSGSSGSAPGDLRDLRDFRDQQQQPQPAARPSSAVRAQSAGIAVRAALRLTFAGRNGGGDETSAPLDKTSLLASTQGADPTRKLPMAGHIAAAAKLSKPPLQASKRSVSTGSLVRRRGDRDSGRIRDLQVLGVFTERLVVSYQGQGCVEVSLGDRGVPLLELEEEWHPSDCKSQKGRRCNCRAFYAVFEVPPLPASIVVLGRTQPTWSCWDARGPLVKPSHEAHTKARIAASGHVVRHHAWLAT